MRGPGQVVVTLLVLVAGWGYAEDTPGDFPAGRSRRATGGCHRNCITCDDAGSCKSCKSGWHGDQCLRSCTNCLGGCWKDNGQCLRCSRGRYGVTCQNLCPPRCLNGVQCDVITGFCPKGCEPGFFGGHCATSCSEHCVNRTCNQPTGSCTYGCEGEWSGNNCTEMIQTTQMMSVPPLKFEDRPGSQVALYLVLAVGVFMFGTMGLLIFLMRPCRDLEESSSLDDTDGATERKAFLQDQMGSMRVNPRCLADDGTLPQAT